MKLFTSLPARRDGTLSVSLGDGAEYVFTGAPLACDVEDEGHADHLQALGFLTADDFEAEQRFLKLSADRAARHAAMAGGQPGEGGDEDLNFGDGLPEEMNSPATGRVRRARK
jgi:hypothetical protein